MAISISPTKSSSSKPRSEKHPVVGGKKSFRDTFKEINLDISFGKKISSKEVMFFTTQLSLMLKTGIPINTGILTISNQIKNPAFKTLLLNLVDHIENGQSLFDAMNRHPEVFPQIYVSMIRAGELSGNLNEMLDRLVSFQKKRDGIFSELRSALAYPIFLVVLSTSVIIFILAVVFPKFGDLFGELGDQLPMTTKVLLSLSHLLTNHALAIVVGFGLFMGITVKFFKTPKGKAVLDAVFTSMPLLKGFILEFHISQLMRTLGTLISGGVPILEALQICKNMVESPRFTRFMAALIEGVSRGEGMAKPMWTTEFLPQMVKEMIKTGEETGSLPEAMRHIADYYDETLEKGLKTFSTILEPLLLVVMGMVVGLVVISLMMPIFKLTQTLH